MREEIFKYVKKKYGAKPDYPFKSGGTPIAYPVLRHEDNRKIFALFMDVSMDKLGLDGMERVDIINVKMGDPLLADMLSQQTGYFHGYHISRGNWISFLLDGTVPFEDICRWIDESYVVTASKQKRQQYRPPKEWLVPANPKYYDIEHAFDHAKEIDWKETMVNENEIIGISDLKTVRPAQIPIKRKNFEFFCKRQYSERSWAVESFSRRRSADCL